MKLNIAQRVLAGYGLALLCMAAIGVTAYRSTTHLMESITWVTHTHLVLREAESVLARLADAESAGRGYVLTGDDGYLQRFESAARLVAGSRKALRDLTADNPTQQRRLDALEPVIEHKIAYTRENIDTRAKQGFPVALRAVETGKGQEIMAEVRSGVAVIEGEEQNLLRQRDEEARARAENMNRVILLIGLFGLVSLTWLGFVIQRSITQPLADFARLATSVGQGDLTQRSVVEGSDELGRLAQGLNRMVTGLREVAEQTRAATENLTTATAEILAAA
ncbi:MAG: methyl-accepting chemotaxis protein, partial [Acidobacteriota bacterium]|nr:methyl-accepting chemotaxis protein [Acidobacteriota bacterium]